MCNLADGIYEYGLQEGQMKGEIKGVDKAIYSYKGYWCAMASRIYCDQLSDEAP